MHLQLKITPINLVGEKGWRPLLLHGGSFANLDTWTNLVHLSRCCLLCIFGWLNITSEVSFDAQVRYSGFSGLGFTAAVTMPYI
jgi:hypothetical protein